MFGIGFLEICLIAVVALVLIGPQKLPQLMVELGKFFVQIRRMSNEVKSSMDQVVKEADLDLKRNRAGYQDLKGKVIDDLENTLEHEAFCDNKPLEKKPLAPSAQGTPPPQTDTPKPTRHEATGSL